MKVLKVVFSVVQAPVAFAGLVCLALEFYFLSPFLILYLDPYLEEVANSS
jgi:hypothetical protein